MNGRSRKIKRETMKGEINILIYALNNYKGCFMYLLNEFF